MKMDWLCLSSEAIANLVIYSNAMLAIKDPADETLFCRLTRWWLPKVPEQLEKLLKVFEINSRDMQVGPDNEAQKHQGRW